MGIPMEQIATLMRCFSDKRQFHYQCSNRRNNNHSNIELNKYETDYALFGWRLLFGISEHFQHLCQLWHCFC